MTFKKKYPRRGFGSMDKEQRRAIASLGGKAAHAQGKAHEWTSEEASAAGRKGGIQSAANRWIARSNRKEPNATD